MHQSIKSRIRREELHRALRLAVARAKLQEMQQAVLLRESHRRGLACCSAEQLALESVNKHLQYCRKRSSSLRYVATTEHSPLLASMDRYGSLFLRLEAAARVSPDDQDGARLTEFVSHFRL